MELSLKLTDSPYYLIESCNLYFQYKGRIKKNVTLKTITLSVLRFLEFERNAELKRELLTTFRNLLYIPIPPIDGTRRKWSQKSVVYSTLDTKAFSKVLGYHILEFDKRYEHSHVFKFVGADYGDDRRIRFFIYCILSALEQLYNERWQNENKG